MGFLRRGRPRRPAEEPESASPSLMPSGGPRSRTTRTYSLASVSSHLRGPPLQGSTIASGPLIRQSPCDQTLSPPLRGSITTDSDAHSEYSLKLRRARKYGVGPSDDLLGTTPPPQPAAKSQRPQQSESPRHGLPESGPAGETKPKEGGNPVCTVQIVSLEEGALPVRFTNDDYVYVPPGVMLIILAGAVFTSGPSESSTRFDTYLRRVYAHEGLGERSEEYWPSRSLLLRG